MEELEPKVKKALIVGALIGALIGAGTAWALSQSPVDRDGDGEPDPISAGEILSLTGALAAMVRMLDGFRRRM